VKRWQGMIVKRLSAAIHEVKSEGNLVRLVELALGFLARLQHLGDHHLRQAVLVHTAGSLVHKDVVENFREAIQAVLEWDRRVEPE